MKRIKQALALALALILALSLAPATAQADPPPSGCRDSPDGVHHWKDYGIVKEPTCTDPGVRGWACQYCYTPYYENVPALGHDWGGWWTDEESGEDEQENPCTEGAGKYRECRRCGEWDYQYFPPLGHAWDEGVVVESDGVLGLQTVRYSCWRCGEINYDIKQPDVSELFDMLRTPPKPKESKLIVTLQPEGGSILRGSGETHTFTVAVEGGEEPYTYEWHRVDKSSEQGSHMAEAVFGRHSDKLAEIAEEYLNRHGKAQGAAGRITGFTVSKEPVGSGAEIANDKTFDPNDHNLGETDEPSYTADRGDSEYYCIIRDSAGDWAVTDSVPLRYRLRIVEEPQSLDGAEGGAFTCRVADGLPPYHYEWWVDDVWAQEPWQIDGADGSSLPLDEFLYDRMIYCKVFDEAGDSVESQRVYAYAGEKFALLDCTPHCEIGPNETIDLEVRFKGGVPPYSATWTKDDVFVEDQTSEADQGPVFTLHVTAPGWYCCTGRDGADNEIPVLIQAAGKQLTILRQPQSGDLDDSGVYLADMEMENGEAPFTYTLHGYGLEDKVYANQGKTPSFEITEPSSYWVYVEDANGQWAESDSFTVSDGELRLIWFSGPFTQTYPYATCALVVEVEGGKKPYTYSWTWVGEGGLKNTWNDLSEDYLYVTLPGWYYCTVKDDGGRTLNVQGINVKYAGDKPVIIQQPQNTVTKYDGPGPVLSCTAVSGTGNNSGLLYYWEVKTETGWTRVSDGKSQTYPVPNTGLGKTYCCMVYDTLTGKYTYSNEVLVYDELACVKSETINEGRLSRWLFTGGVGPYEVSVYSYNPYAEKNSEVYQLLTSYTVSSLGWLKYPHPSSTTCGYEMKITDALGAKVTEMAPIKDR